jgi:hypothetical protein
LFILQNTYSTPTHFVVSIIDTDGSADTQVWDVCLKMWKSDLNHTAISQMKYLTSNLDSRLQKSHASLVNLQLVKKYFILFRI